jgi:hypothetical protein
MFEEEAGITPTLIGTERSSTTNHYIFVVSDGSGETAGNLIRALLTQFSKTTGIYTRRYPKVKDISQVDRIINAAKESPGSVFVAYTLVNSGLREYLHNRLMECAIRGFDLFTMALTEVAAFLGDEPEQDPDRFHGVNSTYFKRMEAIEFTLMHDDGKRISGLNGADVVLVGVSRTGKTPLSMYLSFYGLKVVNIPLALGVKPPKELDEIDQRKIVALTIDPSRLLEIRKRRLTGLKVGESDYSKPETILNEIDEADRFFRKHRRWPVIDVTNRSIEETASLVRDRVFGRDRLVQ